MTPRDPLYMLGVMATAAARVVDEKTRAELRALVEPQLPKLTPAERTVARERHGIIFLDKLGIEL